MCPRCGNREIVYTYTVPQRYAKEIDGRLVYVVSQYVPCNRCGEKIYLPLDRDVPAEGGRP